MQPMTTGFKATLLQKTVWISAILIISFTAYMDGLDLKILKEKLPLKKEFCDLKTKGSVSLIDPEKIAPYKIVNVIKISDEIEEELGTKQYLKCILVDQSKDKNDTLRVIELLITYYTGDPDAVPHVPDVCYLGNGWLIKDKYNTEMRLPGVGADDDRVPLRILRMKKTNQYGKVHRRQVVYYFSVNGTYVCTRDSVRNLQFNVVDKYAYFSKVEVAMSLQKDIASDDVYKCLEKVIKVLTPVLFEDHWPDWDAAVAKSSANQGS